MELWTFDRFRQPRLHVDAIEREEDMIILHADGTSYRLAFDDPEAAERTAADLASLRDSAAPLWATIRVSDPDSPWHQLGTFLDTHSLLGEGHDEAAEALARQEHELAECLDRTAAAILASIPADRRAAAAEQAMALHAALAAATAAGTPFCHGIDPFDSARQPNFYLSLLAVEFDYLRVSSPLTLAMVAALLRRLARIPDETPGSLAGATDVAGVHDRHDLVSHLWLIGRCLALSLEGEEARRLPHPALPEPTLCSGLEYMRRIEILTRRTLSLWGPSPYVAALKTIENAETPLVAGPYIEQYHVTRRFVEIVAPLLSRRLPPPLRALMYRYYSEEVGHEELESTTCEALGVTPRALDIFIPLPLHFAFVDALTHVARTDPIASFAAIMVIEGVFGEPPRMSLRLAAAGADNPAFVAVAEDHEALNIELNHNSIARDCFETIAAVGPATQTAALHRILFLLELNHRAWAGITAFYGSQDRLVLPGPYGTLLDPRV